MLRPGRARIPHVSGKGTCFPYLPGFPHLLASCLWPKEAQVTFLAPSFVVLRREGLLNLSRQSLLLGKIIFNTRSILGVFLYLLWKKPLINQCWVFLFIGTCVFKVKNDGLYEVLSGLMFTRGHYTIEYRFCHQFSTDF